MKNTIISIILAASSLGATPAYDPYNLGGFVANNGRWYRDTGITAIGPDGSIAHAYIDPYNWFWGSDRTPPNETLIWATEGRTEWEEITNAPPINLWLPPRVPNTPPRGITPPPPVLIPTPDEPQTPGDPPAEVPEPGSFALLLIAAYFWGMFAVVKAWRGSVAVEQMIAEDDPAAAIARVGCRGRGRSAGDSGGRR